jgi:Zn-dependent M28 family amino/carboxypeptidase
MKERARLSLTILLLWLLAVPASAQTATRAGGARGQAARGTSARKPAATQTRRANAPTQITILPAAWRAAIERVSADSMRGHLSFLSSDLLEGRKTPSRGLDIAAEYIAAQFRRAGLEPAGDDGYFQTANWSLTSRDTGVFSLSSASGGSAVKVRNVAGILRGSDPTLKDTYVIVSAHYDHLGVREGCDRQKEDCIYNGANDDGSGTVGVVEMASALAKLQPRPKRSILFITFFGEELGLLGSRYYGRHPLVPLAKTVAQVNLEQIGRTDDSEGPQVGTLAVTGFGYSDVGATLVRAGDAVGVKVYQHPTKSDLYFSRSDNQSLADAGVPAHTVGVAFEYPDYHAVGDEWPKVDFANMERVVRAVAAAVLMIADDPREPHWNEQNPKAAQYVEAWEKLHAR